MASAAHPAARADAQRNRQRLIEVALAAFSAGSGKVPLEAIAKDAGVGIGTLYRHFPSREALIEAVYRTELARLCDSAGPLLAALPPEDALRTWMDRYADFVTTKRGMAEALRAVIASGAITSSQTRERMSAAIRTMLDAGAEAGTLRGDVRAEDVSASLAGIILAAGAPEQRGQAGRMLDLLMDGLRPRSAGPGRA
jgi:AcrR family transcriptional regulator